MRLKLTHYRLDHYREATARTGRLRHLWDGHSSVPSGEHPADLWAVQPVQEQPLAARGLIQGATDMARTISGDDPTSTAVYVDVDGDTHFNASSVFMEGALLRLGAPTDVTIASGVATITTGFVKLISESGTTDQLDTLTLAGVGDGDLVLLISKSTDTITVDDANINLGAATRAVAPGGCLLLRYDGAESQWTEMLFLAGADNV